MKNKLRKDKRGTDKVLSVYWFAILFIVAGGVIYMATIYYGKPYDVRDMEANLLTERISDCLSNGGRLVENWQEINNENFLEICDLNFNVEDAFGWKNDQYYVKIDFEGFDESIQRNSITIGNPNLGDFCDKGLICVNREFYTLDDNNKEYVIKIESIVRKTEKNE